jgi:hypothetical protein
MQYEKESISRRRNVDEAQSSTSAKGGDEPRNAQCPVSGRFRLFRARPL